MPTTTSSEKKKAKISMEYSPPAAVPAVAPSVSDPALSGTKSRGRPRKYSKTPKLFKADTTTPVPMTNDTKTKRKANHDNDDDDNNSEVIVVKTVAPPKRRISRTGATVASASSDPSMQRLISHFEEQYKEMGERYQEMGNILQQMKQAAASGRERTEEEIRSDLLEEVRRNILKSLPTK